MRNRPKGKESKGKNLKGTKSLKLIAKIKCDFNKANLKFLNSKEKGDSSVLRY